MNKSIYFESNSSSIWDERKSYVKLYILLLNIETRFWKYFS